MSGLYYHHNIGLSANASRYTAYVCFYSCFAFCFDFFVLFGFVFVYMCVGECVDGVWDVWGGGVSVFCLFICLFVFLQLPPNNDNIKRTIQNDI